MKQEKLEPLDIPVYKGLYKPLFWGGLPRTLFITLMTLTALAVIVLKSPYAVIPVAAVYVVCAAVCRIDQHLLSIIMDSWRMKDVYFPD